MGSTADSRLAVLKAQFGADRSVLFPATFYFALLKDGVEPDSTGNYARVAKVNNGELWNVPAINNGTQMLEVSTKVAIEFPVATDPYQLAGLNQWAIYDNNTGGVLWYTGTLTNAMTISGAGDQIRIPAGALTIGQA